MKKHLIAKIAVGFWACGVFCLAQQSTPHSVTVDFSNSRLTVSISQPSDLASVLTSICTVTQSDCEGVEQAASLKISPETLRGSWNEILDQLLEGTGFNYAASVPSAKSRGHLVLQGKALTLPYPGPSAQNMTPEHTIAAPPVVAGDSGAVPQIGNESGTNDNPESPAETTPRPLANSGQGSPIDMPMASGQFQPFPDSHGNPIPTSNEPASYLPFPDSHGNPIPVSNQPPSYLPFPDSHGNPIPVDNSKPSGSPFPTTR